MTSEVPRVQYKNSTGILNNAKHVSAKDDQLSVVSPLSQYQHVSSIMLITTHLFYLVHYNTGCSACHGLHQKIQSQVDLILHRSCLTNENMVKLSAKNVCNIRTLIAFKQ